MPDDVKRLSSLALSGNPGLRVVGLDHVVLRVADLDRTIAFYGDVLGCPIERRLDKPKIVQLRAGNSLIDLTPCAEGEAPGRNMDHFAIRVAGMDVEAWQAHLTRHSVDAGEPLRRYGAEGYGMSLYITDPDGNTVELKGPPEPAV
jgi:glyoxylase I family protein